MPRQWRDRGQTIILDLGTVANLATVEINGVAVGTLWHAPYRLDITTALRPGPNRVTIGVPIAG